MGQHEQSLRARMDAIKGEIAALGEMRPGVLTKQYNVCGQANCRCKDKKNPRRHGPYHQLSYAWKGRSTSEYVKADAVAGVQSQLADYKRFMGLKDEWVGISIALAKLRRAAKREV